MLTKWPRHPWVCFTARRAFGARSRCAELAERKEREESDTAAEMTRTQKLRACSRHFAGTQHFLSSYECACPFNC